MYTVNNAQEFFYDVMKVKDKNIKTLETKVLKNKIESMESKFDSNKSLKIMNDVIITGPSTTVSRAGEFCGSVVIVESQLKISLPATEFDNLRINIELHSRTIKSVHSVQEICP